MTTKYKTGWKCDKIEKIEVERETDSSVWINGRRHYKRSVNEKYFDTWELAHACLLSRAEQKAADARMRLGRANGELGNVKGMIKERQKEMNKNEQ